MSFSAQDKALVICPKVTAMLSALCSGLIIWDVSKSGAIKNSTHRRLLLGMSVCDALVSFLGYMLGGWAAPADSGAWLASGTQGTCSAQGFFANLGVAVAFYNMSLSVYYLLKIRYNVMDRAIKQTWEPILHLIPIVVGLGTSLAGLLLDQYTFLWFNCWIGSQPYGCLESWSNGGETTCTRGDNSTYYRWILFYAPIWLTLLATAINMTLVYHGVYAQEKRMNDYNFQYQEEKKRIEKAYHDAAGESAHRDSSHREEAKKNEDDDQPDQEEDVPDDESSAGGNSVVSHGSILSNALSDVSAASNRYKALKKLKDSNFRRSRQVAQQGYWYCGVFLLTWVLPSIFMIMGAVNFQAPFWFIIISMTMIPAQGIFNCIVYFYPRIKKHRKRSKSFQMSSWIPRSTAKSITKSLASEIGNTSQNDPSKEEHLPASNTK